MSTALDEQIQKIVVSANNYAWNRYQVILDLSEKGLSFLSDVIDQEREQAASPAVDSFDLQRSSRVWGIYFGELIRKTIGGIWYLDDGQLSLKVFREILSPVKLVKDCLEGRGSATVVDHYRKLCKKISAGTMIQEGRRDPRWEVIFQEQDPAQDPQRGSGFQEGFDDSLREPGFRPPIPLSTDFGRQPSRGSGPEVSTLKPSLIPTLLTRGTLSGILILLYLFVVLLPFSVTLRQYHSEGLVTFYLLSAFFLAALTLPCAIRVLKLYFTEYRITSSKIILDYGVLSRTHKTIPMQKIQDIGFTQTLIERLFQIGDVTIESAGEHGAILLFDLPDCEEVTRRILRILEKSRPAQNHV